MHGALRGMGPAPAGKLGGDQAFALRARGGDDRFQSGLRAHPAPLEYFELRMGPAPAGNLSKRVTQKGASSSNLLWRALFGWCIGFQSL